MGIFADLAGARVLVVGDVILDRYVYGRVERISPEAPIPVLRKQSETAVLGGAGNVARNIESLGGECILVGVCGRDSAGHTVQSLAGNSPGILPELIVSPRRRTSEKIRFVAGRQQILRTDDEDTDAAEMEGNALLDAFRCHLNGCDAVVLSDYAKGVLFDRITKVLIAEAAAAGKPLIVDPKCRDLGRYDGATLLTPNLAEAHAATGTTGDDGESVARSAETILRDLPTLEAVLITRGPQGMTLLERHASPYHMQALAREVFDVSGAGDTVVAALAMGLAKGSSLREAAEIANVAASIAVSKLGTATVSSDELSATLRARNVSPIEAKIVTLPLLLNLVARWKSQSAKVGLTNGCFDLLHAGHVALLARAKEHCDKLVVALNSDSSLGRLKGLSRPVQDERTRQLVLASLAAVDAVILFDDDTPVALIDALRPDVLMKGADYRPEEVVGGDLVKSWGGRVILIPLVPGHSTSNLVARMTERVS